YPPGDEVLRPMIEHNAKWAMGIEANLVNGRWRRCASQQGYALLYMLKLGFYDDRCDQLAERLMTWQWPDGGWNCDKSPSAHCSSFHESLIPTRALFRYAKQTKRKDALAASRRAAEFFLERHLYRSKRTGEVIKEMFTLLKYPYDWRYSFIHALKCMVEANLINDPRCSDALDLLEKKRQPKGGWRAEVKYYSYNRKDPSRSTTLVDWARMNIDGVSPFLTCDATYILRAAGRLGLSESSEALSQADRVKAARKRREVRRTRTRGR
ncbi:MAG TPA: hypothetical protein VL282_19530, partial [Tepidisphaeraceae bacterium]|nr:hypothetical protein [Tepidisphaeraceae bacterium]